ncbi:unnamed protein product [Cuscuta epithymum]|nr:unnamed protein product [Cuscuta epithymum]
MPDYIINNVTTIAHHFSKHRDTIVWTPTPDGSYSFKSANDETRPKKPTDILTSHIWNRNIPTKISHPLQPFQEHLLRFGKHGPFKCPFCNNFDTQHHCYISCEFSSNLWPHFGNLFNITYTNLDPIYTVLHRRFSAHDEFQNLKSQVAIYICWTIWKWRNYYLYDDKILPISEAINYINKELRDASVAFPIITSCSSPPLNDIKLINLKVKPRKGSLQSASWAKLPIDFIKINIAFTKFRDNKTTIGLIIRDDHGHPLHYMSAASQLDNATANTCDILINLKGYLTEENHSNVIDECENSEVIQTLKGRERPRWKEIANLEAFKEVFQNSNFCFTHIKKPCNRAASFIAKYFDAFDCNPNIYSKFVGIVKFDAISYPYIVNSGRYWL